MASRNEGKESPFIKPIPRPNDGTIPQSLPQRHCLACLTGGLSYFYQTIKEKKKFPARPEPIPVSDGDGVFVPSCGDILLQRYIIDGKFSAAGQSAVILKARDSCCTMKQVALKVMHKSYSAVGLREAQALRRLRTLDPQGVTHCITILNAFSFRGHVCLVFPSLDPKPVTQIMKENCVGHHQKLCAIRKITKNLLSALAFLKYHNTIHADVKPENILLQKADDFDSVMLVDFGNAIQHTHEEVLMYFSDFELQALPYRAPEVLVGIPFSVEVDMWSLGCVLLELYTGSVAFPGRDRTQVLQKIISVLGSLPSEMCCRGKFASEIANVIATSPKKNGKRGAVGLMSAIPEITDYSFASFLCGLLTYHPDRRFTPWLSLKHNFMAPEICLQYFLTDLEPCSMVVDKCDYTYRQNISMSKQRLYPSTYDLLRAGTGGDLQSLTQTKVAKVWPLGSSHCAEVHLDSYIRLKEPPKPHNESNKRQTDSPKKYMDYAQKDTDYYEYHAESTKTKVSKSHTVSNISVSSDGKESCFVHRHANIKNVLACAKASLHKQSLDSDVVDKSTNGMTSPDMILRAKSSDMSKSSYKPHVDDMKEKVTELLQPVCPAPVDTCLVKEERIASKDKSAPMCTIQELPVESVECDKPDTSSVQNSEKQSLQKGHILNDVDDDVCNSYDNDDVNDYSDDDVCHLETHGSNSNLNVTYTCEDTELKQCLKENDSYSEKFKVPGGQKQGTLTKPKMSVYPVSTQSVITANKKNSSSLSQGRVSLRAKRKIPQKGYYKEKVTYLYSTLLVPLKPNPVRRNHVASVHPDGSKNDKCLHSEKTAKLQEYRECSDIQESNLEQEGKQPEKSSNESLMDKCEADKRKYKQGQKSKLKQDRQTKVNVQRPKLIKRGRPRKYPLKTTINLSNVNDSFGIPHTSLDKRELCRRKSGSLLQNDTLIDDTTRVEAVKSPLDSQEKSNSSKVTKSVKVQFLKRNYKESTVLCSDQLTFANPSVIPAKQKRQRRRSGITPQEVIAHAKRLKRVHDKSVDSDPYEFKSSPYRSNSKSSGVEKVSISELVEKKSAHFLQNKATKDNEIRTENVQDIVSFYKSSQNSKKNSKSGLIRRRLNFSEASDANKSRRKKSSDFNEKKSISQKVRNKVTANAPEKDPSHCVQEKRSPHCVQEKRSPHCVQEKRSPQCVQEKRSPHCVQEKRSPHCVQEKLSPHCVQEKLSPIIQKKVSCGNQKNISQYVQKNISPNFEVPFDIMKSDRKERASSERSINVPIVTTVSENTDPLQNAENVQKKSLLKTHSGDKESMSSPRLWSCQSKIISCESASQNVYAQQNSTCHSTSPSNISKSSNRKLNGSHKKSSPNKTDEEEELDEVLLL